MNPDKRDELYKNLIGSGKVSESEIGSIDDFKSAIKDEASARQFHENLINSGLFGADEIGSADDFYGSISSDFASAPVSDSASGVAGGVTEAAGEAPAGGSVFQRARAFGEQQMNKAKEAQKSAATPSVATPTQPQATTKEEEKPLGPERFKKSMEMSTALNQQQQSIHDKLEAIRTNPFDEGHEDVMAPAREERRKEEYQQKVDGYLKNALMPVSQSQSAIHEAWLKADVRSANDWKFGRVISNEAARLRHHDMDVMTEDAWNNIPESVRERTIGNVAGVLRESYRLGYDEAYDQAEKIVRGEVYKMMYDEAVRMRVPRSWAEYLLNKVNSNSIGSLLEGVARSKAGTVGDMLAEEQGMEQYRKDNWFGGLAGDVLSFGVEAAGLVGGTGAKLGAKVASKMLTRKFMENMTGKLVMSGVTGGLNLGIFNAIGEASTQFRHGGAMNEDGTIGDYSLGNVGESALHGLGTGVLIGPTGQLFGNAGTKMAKGIESTVGKAAARGAMGVGSAIAEGTIFVAPEMLKGELTLDDWLGSVALMGGFKVQGGLKSAPAHIMELSREGRAGFETRLRSMLERSSRPDYSLTKDEKLELAKAGYGDLSELVEGYKNTSADQRAAIEGRRPIVLEANENGEIPYNRFIELVEDKNVSEAARAKMYYYVTGHGLPMSTVMGSTIGEYADANGNVKGYVVQSFGKDNGVITSKTFKNKKDANMEVERINRQAELNGVAVGEQAYNNEGNRQRTWEACEVVANRKKVPHSSIVKMMERVQADPSNVTEMEKRWAQEVQEVYDALPAEDYQNSAALMKSVGEKHGVDVNKALRKEPKRRSDAEQKALKEYTEALYADAMKEQHPYNERQIPESFQRGYDTDEQNRTDIAIEMAEGDSEEAKEAWKGVEQRIKDDADFAVAQIRETYEMMKNEEDGSVRPATIKGDGGQHEVYIKSGNIVTNADGTVDPEKSEQTIVVYDPVEGKKKQISPSDIVAFGEVTSADDNMASFEMQRQEMIKKATDAAKGVVTLEPGQQYTMPDGSIATVLAVDGESVTLQMPDGSQTSMPLVEVQRLADELMMADYEDRHPKTSEEPSREAEDTVVDGVPEAFVPEMELTLKDGRKVYVTTGERQSVAANGYVENPEGRFIEVFDPAAENSADAYTHVPVDDVKSYVPAAEAESAVEAESQQEEPAGAVKEQPVETPADPYANIEAPTDIPENELLEGWQLIIAARNGDKNAQERCKKFGITWEKKPVVRFVAKGEVDLLRNGGTYQGRFGDGRVDVANTMEPTSGNSVEYRIVFKDRYDWDLNRRVSIKNEEHGEGWLRGGYNLDDVATIERLNEDGTYTVIYTADKGFMEPIEQPEPISKTMPMKKVTAKKDMVDENGKPVLTKNGRPKKVNVEEEVEDWYAATPEDAYTYLYKEAVAAGLDEKDADSMVKLMQEQAQKELEDIKKKPEPVAGSVMATLQLRKERNAELEEAQSHVDYWKNVQSMRNRALLERREAEAEARKANETAEQKAKREAFEAEQERRQAEAEEAARRRKEEDEQKASGTYTAPVQMTETTEPIEGTKTSESQLDIAKRELADDAEAMEILNDNHPHTLEEVASIALRSGKGQIGIIPEDFYSHTGYTPKDAKAYSFILSNDGVTISRLGEIVEGEARNWNIPFDENDATAGLNAVLAVLGEVQTQGDINGYITNNRIRQAYEHHNEMLAREEDLWIEAHDGLTRAEYEAWERSIEEAAAALNGQNYDEYYNKQAENTLYGYDDRTDKTDDGRSQEASSGALQGQEGDAAADTRDGVGGVKESGSRESSVAEQIASQEVNENPTEAQKEAGNYKKAHVRVDGFDVTIENKKGSTRSGVDPNGRAWSQTMNNDYGYILGTEGVDGDHIDVFLSDTPEQGDVFVVDQVDQTGIFDEHKVMYGFPDMESARKAYLANYEEGWQGLGAITPVSKEEFKKWIESSHRKTKPFSEYKSVETLGDVAVERQPKSAADVEAKGRTNQYGVFLQVGNTVSFYTDGKIHHGEIIDFDGNENFTIREWISKREGKYQDLTRAFFQIPRLYGKQTATDVEAGGAVVDKLQDMGVEVSTDIAENRRVRKQAEQDNSDAGKIHDLKNSDGKVYGFAYRGKLYLDPRKIDAELPLHEYGHLWTEAFRILNPEGWNDVVETIKQDAKGWEMVKELYPDLKTDSEIADEVIATFSGKNGAEKLKAELERMAAKNPEYKSRWGNIYNNIVKAIQDFWKKIGDFLGIKYETPEQVYDQVLRDFAAGINPRARVEEYLKERDDAYMNAAESGDVEKATEIFNKALGEEVGNGMTPFVSVGNYFDVRDLAHKVKTRDPQVIQQVAEMMAPLIPDNAVLVPTPSHSGTATDMLDLANAIAKIKGCEVADVLMSAPRESQYKTKKESGQPITAAQMGITMNGTLPEGKVPVLIDNVVDSGNTAEACVKALGKGIVVSLGNSADMYGHAATLKSAAPILKGRDGKIVPLSQRFDLGGSQYLGRAMQQKVDGRKAPLTKVRKAINEQLDEVMGDMLGEDYVAVETPDEVAKAELEIANGRPQMANPVFVSNAMRAVEGIKQEKATAEQWLKMIEKAGGLKAGEDKWTGLSEWLSEKGKSPLTKDEVKDFIRKNAIQVVDVNYAENVDTDAQIIEHIKNTFGGGKSLEELQEEVNENADSADRYDRIGEYPDPDDLDEYLMECMVQEYGDNFRLGYAIEEGKIDYDAPSLIDTDNYDEYNREVADDNNKVINETRLNYTTDFLDNKREIALVVPNIEPWNEGDEVHFGDAGDGRAIGWARFGDAYEIDDTEIKEAAEKARNDYRNYRDSLKEKYGDVYRSKMTEDERKELKGLFDAMTEANAAVIDGRGAKKSKVLVIDEIQSKRHQEGREKGYERYVPISGVHAGEYVKVKDEKLADRISFAEVTDDRDIPIGQIEKIDGKYRPIGSNGQNIGFKDYDTEQEALDVVAKEYTRIEGIPDALFDKNWHELVMKRMLRYAAENGYDKVAWTKGEQQAERYNIGQAVEKIQAAIDADGKRIIIIQPKDGGRITVEHDAEGNVTKMNGVDTGDGMTVKNIAELVGKDMAVDILSIQKPGTENMKTYEGDNLRIGGEGMKGFYDQILPRFMDKYGKKWGVKTTDIELPNIGDNGLTMHSVDVTPEMKASVMEGQPMFHRVFHGSGADFERFDSSHMGEGEGAQSYGYGHYTTEVEGIGRTYATAASVPRVDYRGQEPPTAYAKRLLEGIVNDIINRSHKLDDIKDDYIKYLKDQAKKAAEREYDEYWGRPTFEKEIEFIENLKESDFDIPKKDRTLYTVDIPDDNGSNYLEWDKPASDEQVERIKQALLGNKEFVDNAREDYDKMASQVEDVPPFEEWLNNLAGVVAKGSKGGGERVYKELSGIFGDDKAASEFLHNAGFTGIKYPAQYRSGGRSDNAKNYVIFDDNDLKITDKVKFFRTADGTAYGFTKNGKIYIDKRIATPETRIHEYAHLWAQGLKKRNPDAWKQLKSEMEKQADVMAKVKELYPELIDKKNPDHLTDEMMEEVFAHYSGKRGAERLEADMREEMAKADGIIEKAKVANVFHKIREMLSKFWNMARDLFAGKVEGIEKLSGEDFADMMLGDLLRGFDPRETASRNRLSEMDKAYMEAVERGDMETAQRMVNEAAEKAGYTVHGYHGTRGEFTVFDKAKIGTANDEGWLGRGFYFWDKNNRLYAEQYANGGKVLDVMLKMEEPYPISNEEMERLIEAADKRDISTLEEFTEDLQNNGYDSVVDENGQLLVFNPEQIKSADPVTYDDNGNVIPLSERFNSRNADIRFQRGRRREKTAAEKEVEKITEQENGVLYHKAMEMQADYKAKTGRIPLEMGVFTDKHYVIVNNTAQGNISAVRAFDIEKQPKEIENEIVSLYRRNSTEGYSDVDRQNIEDIRRALGDDAWDNIRTQLGEETSGEVSNMGTRQPSERGAGSSLDSGAHLNEDSNDILFRSLDPESDEVVDNAEVGTKPLSDREKVAKLEAGPKVKVYRSMQLIDGKLYPPMSAKVDGQLREPSELGVWEEADEAPDMADENGKFKLDKGNKKSLKAAYNPYIHTSATMLNDQFSEAQSRPNLVVVECEVPESELTSGYRAEKAKDTVGRKQWKAGVIQGQMSGTREVILSRWAKPVRVVPEAEVAAAIAKQIEGQIEVMPSNVVTPQVREEMEKLGVKFVDTDNTGKIVDGENAGKTWASVYGKGKTFDAMMREGDVDTAGEASGTVKSYEEALAEARAAGYTKKQFDAYIQRQEKSARQRVAEMVDKMRLNDIVTVADTIDEIEGLDDETREARRGKKGWYDPHSGRIVVLLDNHHSVEDIIETLLHEGVGHHGLREMFGAQFDTFLDNVYSAASDEVRQKIIDLSKKHGWNVRTATEEYLSQMAESTDFENPEMQSWWEKIKAFFYNMLRKIGFEGFKADEAITDNELRYVLWRSYQNLVHPGRYRSVVEKAQDVVMQERLKVGDFKTETYGALPMAAENEVKFRDGDEVSDIWNDRSMGLEERITANLARLSALHNDDTEMRNRAYRAIGGNLAQLRKAMSLQKEFDKGTVKRVADLARVLLSAGYLEDMSRNEISRLLSAVKNSTGHTDISGDIRKVMDIMVDSQLRRAESLLKDFESIKASKVDTKGVEVQGELDIAGQQIVKTFKQTRGMSEEEIGDAMAAAQERMGSDDAAVAEEAANEYAGLQMALEYRQGIHGSKVEERELNQQLDDARHATDRNPEYEQTLEEAIRQNRVERLQAYHDLMSRLGERLNESIENAQAFKDAEKARVREIQHNANSDMEGRPASLHYKPTFADKVANNSFTQVFLSPLASFDQILRLFGRKSPNGEGYLWNRFMRQLNDARGKESKGIRNKYRILDEKAKEVWGEGVKSWAGMMRKANNKGKVTVQYKDNGEIKDFELSQGNLMYIYMVNKMIDGRMKLRMMGIDEKKVSEIMSLLDPRLIEIADWLQDEFLVDTRNEYNETHKRMFGAPMDAIEHYFPLKIHKMDIQDKEEELDQHDFGEGITTKTGSIIKRRRNSLALDLMNADAMHVILDHIVQMEHWNAFAEFNRDLNTLRTYKHFRNQVFNMTSVYGGTTKDSNGQLESKLWETFNDVCRIATGSYKPKSGAAEKSAINIAKGFTTAKVSARMFTAFKQFESILAYIPEVTAGNLAESISHPKKAWDWCMDNLPLAEDRWQSRIAGDPRLVATDKDWSGWRNKVVQMASKYGMTPNAFVDAVTVCIGSYAMYKTKYDQYIRDGYSKEAADKRAKQDTEILYNETQQSSEGAYLSPIQVNRTWWSIMLTVFRNSSMSYQRQLHDALRNLRRMALEKGYHDASIEFMAKQIMRDGVEEDKAYEAAERRYNREVANSMLRVATFGFIIQFGWNLISKAGQWVWDLLTGDDDDEKKLWDDTLMLSAAAPLEGLTGGAQISRIAYLLLSGEKRAYKYIDAMTPTMPMGDDMESLVKSLFGGRYGEAFVDLLNITGQALVGVNPQTLTDVVVATVDAANGDMGLAREAAICAMRILQFPQSQIDKMYFDDIELSGSEAKAMTFEQLAERYARYKVNRNTLGLGGEKDMERQRDFADNAIKERVGRMESKKREQVMERNFNNGGEKARKTISNIKKKEYGLSSSSLERKTKGGQIYNNFKRDYVDMAEDVLLSSLINYAEQEHIEEMLDDLKSVKIDIDKWIRGLDDDTPEQAKQTMEDIRSLRRETLDKYESEISEMNRLNNIKNNSSR